MSDKSALSLRIKTRRLPRRVRLFTFLTSFVCLFSAGAFAQQPNWVPVAELLLGSMGNSDASQMSEVMNRCTALNMTLSVLTASDAPDLSRGYEDQALSLIQNGILIEMNTEKLVTGIEPDVEILSTHAVEVVKGMLGNYNEWLENNYSLNGSYFDNDFEIEMKGCELASKFVMQMSSR